MNNINDKNSISLFVSFRYFFLIIINFVFNFKKSEKHLNLAGFFRIWIKNSMNIFLIFCLNFYIEFKKKNITDCWCCCCCYVIVV